MAKSERKPVGKLDVVVLAIQALKDDALRCNAAGTWKPSPKGNLSLSYQIPRASLSEVIKRLGGTAKTKTSINDIGRALGFTIPSDDWAMALGKACEAAGLKDCRFYASLKVGGAKADGGASLTIPGF